MTEPHDTGSDELNAALDQLRNAARVWLDGTARPDRGVARLAESLDRALHAAGRPLYRNEP